MCDNPIVDCKWRDMKIATDNTGRRVFFHFSANPILIFKSQSKTLLLTLAIKVGVLKRVYTLGKSAKAERRYFNGFCFSFGN